MFTYPASSLDQPDELLSSLGTFWAEIYDGQQTVQDILAAIAATYNQATADFNELVNAVSRYTVPVLHVEQWFPWVIKQSQLNSGYGFPLFDDGKHFFDAGNTFFDTAEQTTLSGYPAPAGLVETSVITNRLTATSRTLIDTIDFQLQNGQLLFRTDPFTDSLFPQRQIFQDNVVVDNEIVLWIFRAGFDRQYINNLFAYALGLHLQSTPQAKHLVNALLNACVRGTAQTQIYEAWSAITGVPLGHSDGETVQLIQQDTSRLLIITDKQVYSFDPSAQTLVVVGDTVNRFAPLTDALLFFEFNQGQTPPWEYVKALTLDRGMLAAGFFADLTFNNLPTPLIVTTDEDGFTKVSFALGGFPGDITLFFDELHARGRATGQTLAHLLDQRPVAARTTEPDALALPATINPLAFLCQNVLRSHVVLVRLRLSACQAGTGLQSAKSLRMIIPPQTLMLVLAEMTIDDAPITMDGPGDATHPGYSEDVSGFIGNRFAEELSPDNMQESVRLFQIGGHCV
jgi:hypothetical protein